MTPRDFAFWLMGSLELSEPDEGLNEEQTQTLKNHLNMVFVHMVNEDGSLKDEPKTLTDSIYLESKINC